VEETFIKTKYKINVEKELLKINSKTIFEFEKTIDKFELEKVKVYTAKDEEKTVSFLFYDNDFFAVDRINFKNGYEYNQENEYLQISENLNYKIRKIPNVAKTRKILNIEDIETRIYDVSEYIVLLQKEDVKLLKVTNQTDIHDMEFSEYKLNKDNVENELNKYQEEEEEIFNEERSLRSKFIKLKEKVKYVIVEPFKILKNKLTKANEVQLLSDGKHSIFDKEN
jgi:hypothetical protein